MPVSSYPISHRKNMRRSSFTLIEIVVVVVILGITSSFVIRALRSETAAQLIKRSSVEFETLCGRVRHAAMENSSDRTIVYDPIEETFYMADPNSLDEQGNFEVLSYISWKLPSEFEISVQENDLIEVFRFFPDGGSSVIRKFEFSCKENIYTISVSALTSQVRIEKAENTGIRI